MNGKRILIGVTGGIAAYKVPLLIRQLVKEGADVQVIATESAFDFVTSVTLATLSRKPVLSAMTDPVTGLWHDHVHLGNNADLMVVAPLTANTLAKMAHGLCDNLLLATYLSARCPVLLAPAMDLDMWKHPAVTRNMGTVRGYGNHVVGPATGELASGLTGEGRMSEPEDILTAIQTILGKA
jgi:phosphopantothenoylcysteine decarboxylase / phosphopantothenate---cysteine ligase